MSIGSPQSFNRYAYVGNDPVNFVDPSGLTWMCVKGDNGEKFCFDSDDAVQIYANYHDNLPGGGVGQGTALIRQPLKPTQLKKEPCPPVPVHPTDADIDANIRRAQQHRPKGPFTAYDDAKWFKSMVAHKEEWDYKRRTPDLRYEDFGNFNYGATGAAVGFGIITLLSEAGRVQAIPPGMKEKPKQWGYPAGRLWGKGQYPYGDEPKDAIQIEGGFDYYIRKFVKMDCQ